MLDSISNYSSWEILMVIQYPAVSSIVSSLAQFLVSSWTTYWYVAYCLITIWQKINYCTCDWNPYAFSVGKVSHSVFCQFLICVRAQNERSNYSVDIVNVDKNILFEPSRQFCEAFLFLCKIWPPIVTNAACEINLIRKQTHPYPFSYPLTSLPPY